MFKFVLALTLVAFVAAAPVGDEKSSSERPIVAILKSEDIKSADGSYTFLFESEDGSSRQEVGEISNPGTEDESLRITGSYKYIDANGEEVVVTYTADENGFVPVGTNIPKEISDSALAAREYSKSEPEQKQVRKGKAVPAPAPAPAAVHKEEN